MSDAFIWSFAGPVAVAIPVSIYTCLFGVCWTCSCGHTCEYIHLKNQISVHGPLSPIFVVLSMILNFKTRVIGQIIN